ncbi:HEAT repeat domain-containing protein [Pontibacter locisalis]|uniref:HEAT repeat domain-containing protein n=1 Tax=Pontibacter locisalis TaxID=1719035 RepID=A0ABW5IIG3_9BACT
MKWDNIAIEELLQKYYEGETSVAEEKQLQEFFNSTHLLPDSLKPHAAQFQFYTKQQEEGLSKFLADDWLFEKVEEQTALVQGKQLSFPVQKAVSFWYVAASVLLIIGAFWAGSQYRQEPATVQHPEIAALQQEVQEMKEILTSGASAGYTASDRIQVVSQEFKAASAGGEVINLLVNTMNTDPNVNVRIAACEALYQYKDKEQVRIAYIKSLPAQTDPLMQLTLIDVLVSLQEKKAVEQLQKLAEKKDLLPIVKNKAEEGIGILI